MKKVNGFRAKSFLILCLSFLFITTSYGQSEMAESGMKNAIRYVGSDGDFLIFDLSFNDLPSEGVMLQIRDGQNELVFEERIYGRSYVKRYKIPGYNYSTLYFQLINKKFLFKQNFGVHSRSEVKWEVSKV